MSAVTGFVATTYVRDLDQSRAFYGLLGFTEESAGSNDLSAWSLLSNGGIRVLLATSEPPLEIPALPLLFYFWVKDLDEALEALQSAGHSAERVGYPPHARGGEARTADPDGNTVLLGHADRSDTQPEPPEDDPSERFSLLREAAALAQHRAGADQICQIPDVRGQVCVQRAEVKLADAWGETAWACIPHAEEALITASGAFIANPDQRGLGAFLASRRGD